MIGLPVVELLDMVIVPVDVTAAVGLNCTWRVMATVGLSVTGYVAPVTVKPAPVKLAALTVTGEVPEEVRVNACVVGLPTGTEPKPRLAELTVSCGVATAVPVPLRLTDVVAPVVELLDTTICPVKAPVTVGSKVT